MSPYGTLKRWAELLDLADAVKLLNATLNEETATDKALTGLADMLVNECHRKSSLATECHPES